MTPEDWTGLSAEERAERRIRLLEDAVIFLLRNGPPTTLGMVEDRQRRASIILAARDAARDAETGAAILDAGVMTAEAKLGSVVAKNPEDFAPYPEPDADGWIPWEGGECPIPEAKAGEFSLRFRNGKKRAPKRIHARWWNWRTRADGYSITAYRLHKEPRT